MWKRAMQPWGSEAHWATMTSLSLAPPPLPDWLRALTSATSANHATSDQVADVTAVTPLDRVRQRLAQPVVGNSERYAARAIDAECDKVRGTANGERNHALNAAAYRLGRLVGAGLADQGTVEVQLRDAARACGLDDPELSLTLRSGLRAGMANPREVVIGS